MAEAALDMRGSGYIIRNDGRVDPVEPLKKLEDRYKFLVVDGTDGADVVVSSLRAAGLRAILVTDPKYVTDNKVSDCDAILCDTEFSKSLGINYSRQWQEEHGVPVIGMGYGTVFEGAWKAKRANYFNKANITDDEIIKDELVGIVEKQREKYKTN